ncbi:CAZyme family PL35 [Agaricus bisporus var. burnettii]|uniref:CAZyme family PL35 n=1 Tax=Agaricus bisporus var. burnettii TaxID=192524 RepID=A0A8H7FBH4_AGABI|nr:CAZyme family PL35 [Agaricus bisporus var. burnettii]
MEANYKSVNDSRQGLTPNHPYGAGDPYYAESTGYITPQPAKKRGISNWIKIGVPVLILIIVAAVLGGVLGSRASKNDSASSNGASGAGSNSPDGSGNNNVDLADSRFATATDSQWLEPLYPSTTNTAVLTTPTFRPTSDDVLSWPQDPFTFSNPSPTSLRTDRPRLIAPAYKWQALPALISNDPYLRGWNDTIFANATRYYNEPPVQYFMDGPSGILDNARDVKRRIKTFGYAYRMTNDTRWVDRTWTELQNAANNGSVTWGSPPDVDDLWNKNHFLDTAELSAAFGIAYDFFYDIWTDEQKSMIRFTLLKYGLQPGLLVYTDPSAATYGWWTNNITGNWNCVSNGGLILGSLAILGDDDTGTAEAILSHAIDNAKQNCAFGVTSDGTWKETPNYWYFGCTGHAEMSSALLTATGSDYGLSDVNPDFGKTGLFHMYSNGPGSLFSWGDHGPNKYSSTANCMFHYANQYQQPSYALFQRDQHDAPEPWSMFWYDAKTGGAFWNGAALDHFFDDVNDQWASMRTSWTDNDAFLINIKAGRNDDHQTHNDLDCGDFVMDALGTRWFGDLGSADYRSPDYFSSGDQDAVRWQYYRKMTEGQNTILINRKNQLVSASPTVRHDSTNEAQGSSTVYTVPQDSTAFFVADMSSAYDDAQTVMRGIRFLNGRRQALLQDEINASGTVDWRVHTNATVETSGTSATLKLDGQQLKITMLDPPEGATFTTGAAESVFTRWAVHIANVDQPKLARDEGL